MFNGGSQAHESGGNELSSLIRCVAGETLAEPQLERKVHTSNLMPPPVLDEPMLDAPQTFHLLIAGFDLDGPYQARTVARVQRWPRRSVQARAMVARVELRVELVRQGKSSNNDMVRADGGSRVPDIDGSSSSSSFLATTS
ncbi:hypothetical protein OIU77_028020 [Salix suchowensis]|uniref:Uncharacterized protein n=1 Tax=Salix suchowensis TaxID=1278906 RepID=A0ABQ9BRS2_9ROSI|nr:hypothetical protein OIU77_028020 [Salix suchowensis]